MESETQRRPPTVSQLEQRMVQDQVFNIYDVFARIPRNAQHLMLELQRENHVKFLLNALKQLGPSFVVLDANRPWICYWILHSLSLLGEPLDEELEDNAIDFLNRCQDPDGGYGGGPGQLPHLATTYAAVNALITLGGTTALSSINRGNMYRFLRRMKDLSGAFRMHDAGEMDTRACYTAISVASILNILDGELVKGVGDYILSCQTFEGGIAGEPGSEAHGGHTFCGLAAMILIKEDDRLDLSALLDWVVFRQGIECGFQGRTNKLVDGCYSFWQGAVFSLLQRSSAGIVEYTSASDAGKDDTDTEEEESEGDNEADDTCQGGQQTASYSVDCGTSYRSQVLSHVKREPLFHSRALQQYLILCSQVEKGGFRDKPGKPRDFYHTCYCLSGLSVCQYISSKEDGQPLPSAVVGPYSSNLLEPIHPVYNIVLKQCREAHEFFFRL